MGKRVVGVYQTKEEVLKTVNDLKFDGHQPHTINIIANKNEHTSWLEEDMDVNVETTEGRSEKDAEDPSFWEKVKKTFKGEADNKGEKEAAEATGPQVFTAFGLTDTEAEQYEAEVNSGKIVVLAEETPKGVEVPDGRVVPSTEENFSQDENEKKNSNHPDTKENDR
ncbi:general stress protein [Alkalicoccus daliensis]|uniref:Heat induced stress protein YflT n=1 Tax=Alkalicoccus daliensis TaxID=745820 RepID=A0A1H0HS25_9BACI|nr:general stress protein [Alkalicoccus daliensis]SDO22005.1 Heat induced stress protein YflT [Alkalicoccus daliensis]